MQRRYIVAGIVQNEEKVILGKKAQGRPPYPDVWHTPGGGVEDRQKAESLVQLGDYDNSYFHQELQRELKEELNVSVKNIKCIIPKYRNKARLGETKNKHGEMTQYIFLEYLCDYDTGEMGPADDLAEARWVDKNDLAGFALTPPSEEMYRELGWIK